MEQAQNPQGVHISPTVESVGFPPQSQNNSRKGGGFPKFLIFGVLGLLLIGGAAFFVLRGSEEELEPEATPSVAGIDFIETPRPNLPTPTPVSVNKEALSVQILNGTGIPGEAGYLETQLKSMGYTKTQTGNAPGSAVTATSFTYSSSVPQTVVDELTTKLETIYKTVESKSGATGVDIKIIVGLRKGATAKPAAAAATTTPKPSGSSTPKPSTSPTSTPKPSATPQ